MLSEGSSVKGGPEGKQPSGPYIKESAKISWRVTLALYTRHQAACQASAAAARSHWNAL